MAQGPVFIKEAVLCIQRDSFPDSKTVFQTNNPNQFSHFPFKGQKRNFSGVSNIAESCHKSNWEANLVQIVFTQAINFQSPLPLLLKAASCKLAFLPLFSGECICMNSNICSESNPPIDFWKLLVCYWTPNLEEKSSAAEPNKVHLGEQLQFVETDAQGPQQKELRPCSDTWVLPAKNPFSQWIDQLEIGLFYKECQGVLESQANVSELGHSSDSYCSK